MITVVIGRRVWINVLQSTLLFAAMLGLLGVTGWIVAGPEGLLAMMVVGIGLLGMSARVSPRLVLALYGARPLSAVEGREILRVTTQLARRAGLAEAPRLYCVPSPAMNAFSTGRGWDAVIALTTGLLQGLGARELVVILAHEISHIRNNDTWIMGLADMVSRLTRFMATLGLFLLIVNLPLFLLDYGSVPWLLILLMLAAPTLSALLQLALSRSREYQADLDAIRLTGDAEGLARALERLERYQGGLWERLTRRRAPPPEPSLLRTHPPTAERIRRLYEAEQEAGIASLRLPTQRLSFDHLAQRRRRPHWRTSGLWY